MVAASQQRRAYAFALTSVLLWSTVASAFKITLRYLSPVELVFYASAVSCLVLLFICTIQGKLRLLRRIDRRTIRNSVLFGLLNPFLYYLILFKAYDLLPAQHAQPLNYTWAITLSLLSVPLLGHRLRRLDLLAIGLSYVGVLIISTRGDLLAMRFDNLTGVALALGSTVIWALYWIVNTRDKRDPVVALLLNFVCVLPIAGLYLAYTEGFRPLGRAALIGVAYIGTFEMGVAFVTWLMAMKLTGSTAKIANLIFISPFLSLVFIHVLVGETILISSVFGLAFIVSGLIVQSRSSPARRS